MARKVETCFVLVALLVTRFIYAAENGDEERKLLLSFKASVNDPFRYIANWNVSENFCKWYGVSCSNSSHVSQLLLSGKNITGKLSPSIFLLPFVEKIDLSNNALSGELPYNMFSTSSLRHLNLTNNNFTGSIPYGSVPGLETLDISNNMLAGGIPPEIGLFSSLRVLDIGGNVLVGEIPNSISNLQSLQFLTLAGNQLIGEIPSELGHMGSLTWIYIGYNNLSGEIPKELGYLSSLNHLDLVYNNLTGEIPSSLGNLTSLRYLFLYQNRLTGLIPTSIYNLRNLISLDLSDNYLSGGIPELIVQLKNLEILHLFSNGFTGKIPRGIAFLPRLQVLQLWSNQFSGEIPQNLGRHNNLTVIDLSTNNLTGTIPDSLCASRHLFKLILFSNFLEGAIPRGLSYCTSLERIRIQNNRLTGHLPGEFTKLRLVYYLDVSANCFSGTIDGQKWDMPLLEMLSLAGNSFTGSLPEFIHGSKLEKLDLSGNNFSGNIPTSYAKLSELMQLNLRRNLLSGFIPTELSSCDKLVHLDLSKNQLMGEIPVSFSSMPVLGQLDLSDNHLSGEIPSSLGNTESLVQVNISHNNFQGCLPLTIAFLAINASSVAGNHLCGGDAITGLPPCRSNLRRHVTWLYITSFVVALLLFLFSILLAIFIQRRKGSRSKKVDSYEHGVWDLQFIDSKASKSIAINNIISSMEEENVISRSTNATIYKGKSPRNGLQFVIKELPESCSLSTSFWDENCEKGKLRHPNVVKLLGKCKSEKNCLLVYEFIGGKSLNDVFCGMSWESRSKVVVGIAKALQYLHFQCSPRVLVGNISLENVIVDWKDEPHMLVSLSAATNTNFKDFTSSAYAAPETITTNELTDRSDIYAFGVLIIQIVCGKGPADAELGVHDNIVQWARHCYSDCHIDTWIDAELKGMSSKYSSQVVEMMNLALQCTATDPIARPCAKDVSKTVESFLRSKTCT